MAKEPAASDANLVGSWRFDEASGTTALDASSSGNVGTLTNGPTRVTGKLGTGLSFDGADDVVDCGSASSLDDMSAFTIAGWIYPTGYGENNNGRIVQKVNGSTSGWLFFVTNAVSNSMKFIVDFNTTDLNLQAAANSITMNTWQHVALTWDGSTTATNAHMYVNGVEVSSYSLTTNGAGTRVTDASQSLKIGNNAAGDRTFAGNMDEMRVYSRVLTIKEIAALAATPTGSAPVLKVHFDESSGTTAADVSGNGNNGTLSNGPTWTTGQIGGGLSFDGADDVVSCGSPAVLDDMSAFTVAGWIYPTGYGEANTGRIAEKANGFVNGWLFYVTNAVSNSLKFVVDYNTTDLNLQAGANSITMMHMGPAQFLRRMGRRREPPRCMGIRSLSPATTLIQRLEWFTPDLGTIVPASGDLSLGIKRGTLMDQICMPLILFLIIGMCLEPQHLTTAIMIDGDSIPVSIKQDKTPSDNGSQLAATMETSTAPLTCQRISGTASMRLPITIAVTYWTATTKQIEIG